MWSEPEVREYTRKRIDKDFYISASTIVLGSFYEGSEWRFDKMRAVVEHEIQIYKGILKTKEKEL